MISKTGEVIIDAFGVVRPVPTPALKCDRHTLEQYEYALNKETGAFEVKVTGKVDLTEIIESNKDNCGLNLAFLNIARGADPSVYLDDGQHGGDFTKSININEAYQDALKSKEVIQGIAKELNISDLKGDENLSEVIGKAIAKRIGVDVKAPESSKMEGEVK